MKKELLRQFDLSDEQIEQIVSRYEDAVKSGVPFVICDTRHVPAEKVTADFLAVNASTSFGKVWNSVQKCDFDDNVAKTALLLRQDPEAVCTGQKNVAALDQTEEEQRAQYEEQHAAARAASVPFVIFDARHLSLSEYKKQFGGFEIMTSAFGLVCSMARKGLCRVKLLRGAEVLKDRMNDDEKL